MPRDGFCGSQMLLICAAIGCFDEMLAGARLQRQQAPASAYGPYDLSGALMVNGKLDEAAAVALRGREQFDLIGGLAQPNILWRLGLYAEAVESRSWLAAAVGNGEAAGEIARRGAREARDAWRWAAEQQAGGRLEYPNVNDTLAARTYAELGELELALAALERAVAEHEPFPEFLGMDPIFFPLLGEPRFQALLEKMGLAAYRENYVKHARALAELKVQPMPQASPPR
jgi:tetratricopeptide (TPR) repeat protein